MNKLINITQIAIPIFVMIALVPLIQNDYVLAVIYIGLIFLSLVYKYSKNDVIVFFLGFIIMAVLEYIFVSTGVESFSRNSLFASMPIWLPFLWGYGFVAIKRVVKVLDEGS